MDGSMSETENQEEEFSPEVLLNPELLDEFINMFSGRLAYAEGEKVKTEKTLQDQSNQILLLQNKLEVLLKYKKFQALNGFGYTKQTADEFFENMTQANQDRIQFSETCSGKYMFMQMEYQCSKVPGHPGPCGGF
jgi:hypothetical protein